MTRPATLAFATADLERLAELDGRIAVVVPPTGKLDQTGRRLNRLMRGALERFVDGEIFAKMKEGEARDLLSPSGMVAEAVQVVKLDRKPEPAVARRAGAAIGKAGQGKTVTVLPGVGKGLGDLALGAVLVATTSAQAVVTPHPGWPLTTFATADFSGSGTCAFCHSGLRDQAGADVSIDAHWRVTMMAPVALPNRAARGRSHPCSQA